METALSALSRRRLSSGQLLDILRRKGCADDDARACLAKLEEWGYLDDRSFAKDLIGSMLRACPIGKRRAHLELSKRLFQKELAEEVVREAYCGLIEEDLALEAARRYLNGKKVLSVKEQSRLGRWLLRQGFESEIIGSVLRRLGKEELQ